MSENNYGALMLKSVLGVDTNITKVTTPGIYPVTQNNTSAPDKSAGILIVSHGISGLRLVFTKESSSVFYSLINGIWVNPNASDVNAVEAKGDLGASPGGTAWDNSWIGVTGGDGDIPGAGNDFVTITLVGKGKNASGSYQLLFDGDTTTTITGLHIYARGLDIAGTLDKTKSAELYHTGHKPSAADVGALSSSGGTLNGNLTVKNTIQVGGVGNGALNIGDSDSGLRSSVDGQVDLWSNNQKVGYWKTGAFSFTGQFVPTDYSNFNAKYQAKGNYTPAGQAYTKAESDGRFQPKGNYTPAGQAYTKAESDARYLQDSRLGSQGTITSTVGGNSISPAGCIMTGYFTDGSANVNKMFYRPQQKYKNGVWATISQL